MTPEQEARLAEIRTSLTSNGLWLRLTQADCLWLLALADEQAKEVGELKSRIVHVESEYSKATAMGVVQLTKRAEAAEKAHADCGRQWGEGVMAMTDQRNAALERAEVAEETSSEIARSFEAYRSLASRDLKAAEKRIAELEAELRHERETEEE